MNIFTVASLLSLAACSDLTSRPPSDWGTWSVWVEARYPVSDEDGHGPDIGSDEWARALQWRLGIVNEQGHGPDLGSAEWRAAVEKRIGGLAE